MQIRDFAVLRGRDNQVEVRGIPDCSCSLSSIRGLRWQKSAGNTVQVTPFSVSRRAGNRGPLISTGSVKRYGNSKCLSMIKLAEKNFERQAGAEGIFGNSG